MQGCTLRLCKNLISKYILQSSQRHAEATFNVVQRKGHSAYGSFDGRGDEANLSMEQVDSVRTSFKNDLRVGQDKEDKFENKNKNWVVTQRRDRVPEKPNISFSLWSIMKNCIGKDLSKIPVPVNFSEPLSMLQRLVEDFEYSEILDKASQCKDNFEQLAYVAAFTVSAYSTTAIRTGKPFNPLLGNIVRH